MLNRIFGRLWIQKKKLNKDVKAGEAVEPTFRVEGTVHYCLSLSPEALLALTGGTRARVPLFTWYKALWNIQHAPKPEDYNVYVLSKELQVSWPTASLMKKKIIKVLTEADVIRHE